MVCYDTIRKEHAFFLRKEGKFMNERELQKKIDSIDKKLKRLQFPRGEGSISWKNKKTCYLEYKKPITYPDDTTERISVFSHELEPLMGLMKIKEEEKQELWKLNHMRPSESMFIDKSEVMLGDSIKNWFYRFRYLNRRGRTFDREESTLNNQILKYTTFINIEMQAITDVIIQDHITTIMKNYSYSTVKKTYELLDQFFRYYYSKNMNGNPMNTVTKPKESDVKRISSFQSSDIRFFTPDEIETFTHEALLTWSNGNPKYKFGVGLLLIMYTGIRAGEARGCRWKHIDFEQKYLRVKEASSYEKIRDENLRPTGKLKQFIDAPKTKAGVRDVYLLKQALEYAKRLKEQQNPLSEEEYIFATNQNSAAVSYYNLRRTFNLICKNCGIQDVDESIGLHVLRHTFVSMLCRKGIDKLVIASIVGQADTKMIERVYYHIMQEEKDLAIKKLEQDIEQTDNKTNIFIPSQLGGLDIDKIVM